MRPNFFSWHLRLWYFWFSNFQLKSAYAINKLRKSGYSKNLFYKEAINVYKEVCSSSCSHFSIFSFVLLLSIGLYSYFLHSCINLLIQINTLLANGDKNALRKAVTEKMYSVCFCFFDLLLSFLFEILIYLPSAVLLFSWCKGNGIKVLIHYLYVSIFRN